MCKSRAKLRIFRLGTEGQHLRFAALDQRAHMVRPQHQRSAVLLRAHRNCDCKSGDAGLVSRNVVQRRLDDVRLGAEIGHPRRNGPAQIMQFPRGHLVADARVQLALGCFPLRKAESRSLAKQLIAPRHAWNCGDDVERRLRQRQHVCSSVFAPRGRQRPRPYVQFDLGPAQAADLGATGASEDQELDRLSESVVTTGVPDRGQLAIGQHARAWHGILRLERSDNGIVSARPWPSAQA